MKAILVIDVEEYGEYYADVYRRDDDDRFEGRHYFKPMPQPKEITREWLEGEYENGWNDCLEELEKMNDFIPNSEVIYKEMTSEQKLKLLCDDFANTKGMVSAETLYILCLTAYYMGKSDGLEIENDTAD